VIGKNLNVIIRINRGRINANLSFPNSFLILPNRDGLYLSSLGVSAVDEELLSDLFEEFASFRFLSSA